MHNAAFADHMERWGRLDRGVTEHASGAAFLRPAQETLIQARAEAWEAKQRQLRHRAAAQQATRDLEAAMAKAHEAATRLQHGLLAHYGDTNPKLVEFGMHPRRVGKARARLKVLEALAALRGTPPHRSADPAPKEAAAPSAGGDVPQAEADAAAFSRTAREGGGEAPQAEEEVSTRGGTAPPAVEAAPTEIGDSIPPGSVPQPATRIIPIWMRVPPTPRGTPLEPGGAPQPGFVMSPTPGEPVVVAPAV